MSKRRDSIEPAPEFDNKIDKFKYWFTNIFWFHYRLHTIAVIIGAAAVISVIASFASNREPDFIVAAVTYAPLSYEETDFVRDGLAGHIGDLNGDGAQTAEFLQIFLGAEDPQMEIVMRTMLVTQPQRGIILLYIFDEAAFEEMREHMPFMDISGYFSNTAYSGQAVDISGSATMQRLSVYGDVRFYAAILDWESKPREFVDVPVDIIRFLLEN